MRFKTPFQPDTTEDMTGAKISPSLSSIYLSKKSSTATTDFIIPIVDIFGTYFINDICCGYPYKILAKSGLIWIRLALNILWSQVSLLLLIVTIFKIHSFVTYRCANTFFLLFVQIQVS